MGHNFILECQSRSFPFLCITLVPGKLVVGRSRSCGIHVPDPTVSRRHAEIFVSGQEVNVIDLESHNGTFVEDAPVESSPVRLGQFLRFGAVPFRLASSTDVPQDVESEIETHEAADRNRVSRVNPLVIALSPAQRRVVDLLLSGLAEKEVAARLELSRNTVHNHTREIYRIVGVHSRAELLARLLPRF
ncbi:MAG: garA 3 [Planctomycetaceae bacterium]|nr:garA 3 [Planctomycetaceae bacterium]